MAKKSLKQRWNTIRETVGIASDIVSGEIGDVAGDAAKSFKQSAGEAIKTGRANGEELLERGKEITKERAAQANDTARKVAKIGAEKYEEHEIDARLIGAGVGAKAGLILGARGGLLGAKVGIVVGGTAGAVLGPDAVKKFMKWRDQEPANDDQSPETAAPSNEPPESDASETSAPASNTGEVVAQEPGHQEHEIEGPPGP